MRLISSLLAFALVACGSGPAPASPALWQVSDPDTTIYLFGTVHVLPEKLAWRTERFNEALASADELVLELADRKDQAATARTFLGLAVSPGLPPVLDRVAADKREALARVIAKAGLTPEKLDPLETWAVAITLGATLYASSGFTPENGVETKLETGIDAAGKPIRGLETTAQQLGYFDTLAESAQRQLLESIVDESQDFGAQFSAMVDAWARGDTAAIAATFDDELRASPELAEVLLDRRNAAWAEWMKARLATPGTAFVAVGAGHLVGKDSVIDKLRAAGLRVERIQ